MKRRLTALCTDIVIDFPVGLSLDDPNHPKIQEICREEFIDFLQSSENMTLSWQISDDPEEDSVEKVNTIKEVLYKLQDNQIFKKPAYAFSTDDEIYVDEADVESTIFLLEQEKDGTHIHVLENEEEYWTNEEVTDLFESDKILELCEQAENVPDNTEDFREWRASIDRFDDELEDAVYKININL
jgi:hypothetical protein